MLLRELGNTISIGRTLPRGPKMVEFALLGHVRLESRRARSGRFDPQFHKVF
jgi:hypothetical protein